MRKARAGAAPGLGCADLSLAHNRFVAGDFDGAWAVFDHVTPLSLSIQLALQPGNTRLSRQQGCPGGDSQRPGGDSQGAGTMPAPALTPAPIAPPRAAQRAGGHGGTVGG